MFLLQEQKVKMKDRTKILSFICYNIKIYDFFLSTKLFLESYNDISKGILPKA